MISFKNVVKLFGLRKVLDNVSFSVKPGEFVAIIGPSGAGKSTLIHLLIGAMLPTAGEISIDDVNVHELDDHKLQALRRNMGIVFQDNKLLPKKTVWENMHSALYGEKNHEKTSWMHELLERLGMKHRTHALPHELSGGEAQRAALARALVHRPSLIIADEPTGHLDPENEEQMIELLKELHKAGHTIVITTHKLPLAKRHGCRIIHLKDGKMEEEPC